MTPLLDLYPPVRVLITMKQFNQIACNKETKTLDVGAGYDISNFFDIPDYSELGVVGEDYLVGVSGWLLSGGYSLPTNKHRH